MFFLCGVLFCFKDSLVGLLLPAEFFVVEISAFDVSKHNFLISHAFHMVFAEDSIKE